MCYLYIIFSLFGISHCYDWLHYGFDISRSGYNPYESNIISSRFISETLTHKWDLSVGTGVITSQPLYVDEVNINGKKTSMLFVGSDRGEYYAIDVLAGSIIWKTDIGVYSGTSCSSPLSSTGVIDKSSSSLFLVSSDGNFHRLLLSTGSYYSSKWPIKSIINPSEYQVSGALTMYLDKIYIPVSTLCEGTTSYGGKVFSFEVDGNHAISHSNPLSVGPIAGLGGLSISTTSVSGSPNIYLATQTARSPTSSESKYPTTEALLSLTAGLGSGKSYSQDMTNELYDFVSTPIVLTCSSGCQQTVVAAVNRAGKLYLMTSDLQLLAKVQVTSSAATTDGLTVSAPAFDSSRNALYMVTPQGEVVAFVINEDCSARLLWRSFESLDTSSSSKWTAPTVAGGVVYVASAIYDLVYALDADTGGLLWYAEEALGSVLCSPIVVDGHLFIADSGYDGTGVGSRVWMYSLAAKSWDNAKSWDEGSGSGDSVSAGKYYYSYVDHGTGDGSATVSNDFTIVVGGKSMDITCIASIGTEVLGDHVKYKDTHGNFIQRVYNFDAPDGSGAHFNYWFRIPVAGEASLNKGMVNAGVSWNSPVVTDAWRSSSDGLTQTYLGQMDRASWKMVDGERLQVHFAGGQYCAEGGGYASELTAIFSCSNVTNFAYSYSEYPLCHHQVHVSSSKFCGTLTPRTASSALSKSESTAISNTQPTSDSEVHSTSGSAALFSGTAGTPSTIPSTIPTFMPTPRPTAIPTAAPTMEPTSPPTVEPSSAPTAEPSTEPTTEPSTQPTTEPTTLFTTEPSTQPTTEPTILPTAEPFLVSTSAPSFEPTAFPTISPVVVSVNTAIIFTVDTVFQGLAMGSDAADVVKNLTAITRRSLSTLAKVPEDMISVMEASPTASPSGNPTASSAKPTLESTTQSTSGLSTQPTGSPSPGSLTTNMSKFRALSVTDSTLEPAALPTGVPTSLPSTALPTGVPTSLPPTGLPTGVSTSSPPTGLPTNVPISLLTVTPSVDLNAPTMQPATVMILKYEFSVPITSFGFKDPSTAYTTIVNRIRVSNSNFTETLRTYASPSFTSSYLLYVTASVGFISPVQVVSTSTPTSSPTSPLTPIEKLLCELVKTSDLRDQKVVSQCESSSGRVAVCNGSVALVAEVSCSQSGGVIGLTLANLNINVTKEFSSALSQLTSLLTVDISSSRLSPVPTIPTAIGSLTGLTKLVLSSDGVMDTLSSPVFANLSSLQDLRLDHNSIYGTIPASFGGQFSLTYLDLSYNQLTGSVPESLYSSSLMYLELSGNPLSCYAVSLSRVHNNDFVGLLPVCTAGPTAGPSSQPSLEPSTGTPSSSPTPLPTTSSPTSPDICLNLLLMDKFGDGWGDAELSVFSSRPNKETFYTVGCGETRVLQSACFTPGFNQHGDFIILSISGFEPAFAWEISWLVYNEFDKVTYAASHLTTMKFVFRSVAVDGEMVSSIAVDNVQERILYPKPCHSCYVCDAEDDSSPGKPSPKQKKTPKQMPKQSTYPSQLPSQVPTSKYIDDESGSGGDVDDTTSSKPAPKQDPKQKPSQFPSREPSSKYTGKKSDSGGDDDGDDDDTTISKPAPKQKPSQFPSREPSSKYTGKKNDSGGDGDDDDDDTSSKPAPKQHPKRKPSQLPSQVSTLRNIDDESGSGGDVDDTTSSKPAPKQDPKQKPSQLPSREPSSKYTGKKNDSGGDDDDDDTAISKPAPKQQPSQPSIPWIPGRRSLLAPKKGPDVVDMAALPYTLSQENSPWFNSEGFGVDYFVSDSRGSEEVAGGTLCLDSSYTAWILAANKTGHLHLSSGHYLWRVTGALDDDTTGVSWDFCGSSGSASTQILFQVFQGVCSTLTTRNTSQVCADNSDRGSFFQSEVPIAEVTVNGVLELHGIPDTQLSATEQMLLRSALSNEFEAAKIGPIALSATSVKSMSSAQSSQDGTDGSEMQGTVHRSLKTSTNSAQSHRLTFELTFSTSHEVLAGADRGQGRNGLFAEDLLKSYVDRSMASGLFLGRLLRLTGSASEPAVRTLRRVSAVSLLELRVLHRTVENVEVSIVASAAVIISCTLGLVSGTLFLLYMFGRRTAPPNYSAVSQDNRDDMDLLL